MARIKMKIVRKRNRIVTACLLVLYLTISATAQARVSGNWQMEAGDEENLPLFSIRIKLKGGRVSGHLYFVKPSGESETIGFAVPFIGTVKGRVTTIEFDPNRGTFGNAQDFKYEKPKSKTPSFATLTLKNGKLEWRQTQNRLGANMPETFTLIRSN